MVLKTLGFTAALLFLSESGVFFAAAIGQRPSGPEKVVATRYAMDAPFVRYPLPNATSQTAHVTNGETTDGLVKPFGSVSTSSSTFTTDWSVEGINALGATDVNGNETCTPADSVICAGNGYVFQIVRKAVRVISAAQGSRLTATLNLGQFFRYRALYSSPYCHYDLDADRWFATINVKEGDRVTYSRFTGRTTLLVAVSDSGDPTANWTYYRLDTTNDGLKGTPNHRCRGDFPFYLRKCESYFPKLSVDKHGMYLSTIEYGFDSGNFRGAQIYAVSKSAIISGSSNVTAFLYDTSQQLYRQSGNPGDLVQPALSAGSQSSFSQTQNGTQYFVSSTSYFNDSRIANTLVVWALTGTYSLETAGTAPTLKSALVTTQQYAEPPNAPQKNGTVPLGMYFHGVSSPTVLSTGESLVSDLRYADGKLWVVLATATSTNQTSSSVRSAVAWFILEPSFSQAGDLSVAVVKQGVVTVDGEWLSFPTLGVTDAGQGIISFSRVGPNLFPSLGYVTVNVDGVSDVGMIQEGHSPADGFTQYNGSPLWGRYAGTAVVGDTVYTGGPYIEQGPCTVAEWAFTHCNKTRTQKDNWSTRIVKMVYSGA